MEVRLEFQIVEVGVFTVLDTKMLQYSFNTMLLLKLISACVPCTLLFCKTLSNLSIFNTFQVLDMPAYSGALLLMLRWFAVGGWFSGEASPACV